MVYVSKERLINDAYVQIELLEDMILYHETNAKSNPEIMNSEVQLMSQYMAQKSQLEEVITLASLCDENTLYKEEDGMFFVQKLSKEQYDEFINEMNESYIPYQ